MNDDWVELDRQEVLEHEVGEATPDDEADDDRDSARELIESFAFQIYQQQSEISSDTYISGVDRYAAWLELMAARAKRKDYPANPLAADQGHVYDYFSWLVNTDWSVNTRKSYFASVQRFYAWIEQSGKGENITEPHSIEGFNLDPGALEKSRQDTAGDDEPHWIPREEAELLWHPDNVPSPRPMYELAFKLMWHTTMRCKAMTEIKIDNIDREAGRIVIPNLKPGDDEAPFRQVLYPVDRIEPLLVEWLDREKRDALGPYKDSEYLFPTHQSEQLNPSRLSRMVKQAAKSAGINEVEATDAAGKKRWKITGHTLRHSGITYLANETQVPIQMVKRQAGHSKIETTLSYVHDDDDAFHRALNAAWE